ncbi:MAG: ATP-binding cassette domain-containing protein, partial [Eubacteriales bacterium]|nr:ATP-binding cassette domain-containing protein [Eubacteriales bacterium]
RTSLWWDVPLMDSLRILKEMYRVDDAVFRKNVEKFTDILELSGFLHQPVRQLSLGQRMRADLAAAMIHSPRVLFLDEPTIGLDVIARQRLREFIQEINRESDVTILLTTHDMVEMERLASRILVIDQGRLIFSGDVAGLRRAYGYERSVRVEFAGEAPALELEGAQVAREAPDALSIAFDARRHSVGDVLAAIRQTDARIHDVTVHDTDIDQIVRNIYTRREA